MLDTNICAFVLSGKSDYAFMQLTKHNREEVCISAIVAAELYDGIENGSGRRRAKNLEYLEGLLGVVKVVDFNENAAKEYGKIKTNLRKRGEPIGPNDMLIAAHAKSLGLTLVTNNTKEFSKVRGLRIEDWS